MARAGIERPRSLAGEPRLCNHSQRTNMCR
jgi:hypothetical protein